MTNSERGINGEENRSNLRVLGYTALLAIGVLSGSVFVNEALESTKEGTSAVQNHNITVAADRLEKATKDWAMSVVGILASSGLLLIGFSGLTRNEEN